MFKAALAADQPPAPRRTPDAATATSRDGFVWAIIALGLLTAAVLVLLPLAASNGPEFTAITPAFASVVFVTELTTSFLLFVQFRHLRTWSLLLLGCAYLFSSLMPILHLLTFPGAILPGRIILGSPPSTAWAFLFWMSGYSTLTLASVLTELVAPDRKVAPANTAHATTLATAAVLAVIACCTLASTAMVDRLPSPMAGAAWTGLNATIIYAAMTMIAVSVLLIVVAIGRRNPLFLWLGGALAAVLAANILSLAGGGRYTIGWSAGRLTWTVSATVLLIFFMGQFARQQRALVQAREALEQRVAERTADLTRTVHQRDLLLREVHHRVKNNLQVVDSLLHMEGSRVQGTAAREAFERLRRRVFALGLAHQQIVSSDDLQSFSILPFLQAVLANLSSSLGADEAGITVGLAAEPLPVNLDLAIPAGLIVTELVSRASRTPTVRNIAVEFRAAGAGTVLLAVAHDAAAAASPEDQGAETSRRLVAGLTRQLRGRMEIVGDRDTRVEILMPLPEPT